MEKARILCGSVIQCFVGYSNKKQPSRGVFIKRCSENMQQIYRRTLMPKCDFNKLAKATLLKSRFGIGVLLWICCIFSEHLFSRTPLDGCFCLKYLWIGGILFLDCCTSSLFHATVFFLYPLKTTENLLFSCFLISTGGKKRDSWHEMD